MSDNLLEWREFITSTRRGAVSAMAPLIDKYGFQNVENDTSDDLCVDVIAANRGSFVSLTWYQRDGVNIDFGPIVDGEVPDEGESNEIGICSHYSPDVVEICTGVRRPPLVGDTAEAYQRGVQYLIDHASDFLAGKWRRRPVLDGAIKVLARDRCDEDESATVWSVHDEGLCFDGSRDANLVYDESKSSLYLDFHVGGSDSEKRTALLFSSAMEFRYSKRSANSVLDEDDVLPETAGHQQMFVTDSSTWIDEFDESSDSAPLIRHFLLPMSDARLQVLAKRCKVVRVRH